MMAKPLRLFNLLLALLALFLLGALANSLFNLRLSITRPRAVSLEQRATSGDRQGSTQGPEADVPPPKLQAALPPLSDFEALVAKDPFRNPFKGTEAGPQAAKATPPTPLPTLLGTVFVGDEKKAILKDGTRVDTYAIGQSVAGGTLVEIRDDRVMLKRGESTEVVFLKASIEEVRPPGQPGGAPGAVRPAQVPRGQQASPPQQQPGAGAQPQQMLQGTRAGEQGEPQPLRERLRSRRAVERPQAGQSPEAPPSPPAQQE